MQLFALVFFVSAVELNENPIRRVVNLLQMTQKKIEEEGEQMEDMFDKFMCYCKTNTKALDASIAALGDQIPQIEASVKGTGELKTQLNAELVQHKQDREDAKGAIEAATEQRTKDKAAFDAYDTEAKTNLAALKKAEAAIRKGMGESFLQSASAQLLARVVQTQSSKMSAFDAEEVTAFLQGKEQGSGEIVGILSTLAEEMAADLKDATETEAAAVTDFEGLVAAKEKEVAFATEAVEAKLGRAGKAAVDIVNAKNDLEDAQEALADDTEYIASLKKTCAEQEGMMEQITKTRSEELAAIGITIKILNDDDALDLFKKSLPGDSFLQTGSTESLRARARVLIKAAQEHSAVAHSSSTAMMSQFMLAALSGKKVGFDKVLAMMDKFVVTLKEEQKDDDDQKAYCNKEFEKSEDEEADLKRKIGGLETAIEEGKEAVAGLADGIAALEQGIKDLDAAVADATATRKTESTEYIQTKAGNSAAVQLLEVAKNQLNKFYNPKSYKAPPKRELTEEERLYVASGGVLTTPAPGGIAGTGITVFAQLTTKLNAKGRAAPPPPPAAIGAYKKQDSSGPVQMLSNLMQDLKLEMTEDDMEEKAAQKDYEELMAESAKKRATDAKTIVEKETQKADAEDRVGKAVKDHKASQQELMALVEYIAGLHASCDFLVENYDLRKEARASEIESIQKAKAVLSGADYSFMQVESQTRFLHSANELKCQQDSQRRVQLLQSLTVLASDLKHACAAMGKACPEIAVPKEASWDDLMDLFDVVSLNGKKVF